MEKCTHAGIVKTCFGNMNVGIVVTYTHMWCHNSWMRKENKMLNGPMYLCSVAQ